MRRTAAVAAAVVLLAGVVAGVDRIAAHQVAGRMAETVERNSHATGVDVRLHGFPFLTNQATGTVDSATVTADSAVLGGVRMSNLTADLQDAGISTPYLVQSAVAHGDIATPDLGQALRDSSGLDVDLTSSRTGLSLHATLLGTAVSADARLNVATPHALAVRPTTITVGGRFIPAEQLPGPVTERITTLTIPLDLPDNVAITGVSVHGNAVRISLSGTDVPLQTLVTS